MHAYLYMHICVFTYVFMHAYFYMHIYVFPCFRTFILDVILCMWYGHWMYDWLQTYIEGVTFFTHPAGSGVTRGGGRQHGRPFPTRLGQPENRVEMASSYTCGTKGLLPGVPGTTTQIRRSVSFVNVVSSCLPTVREECSLSNIDCLPVVNNDN